MPSNAAAQPTPEEPPPPTECRQDRERRGQAVPPVHPFAEMNERLWRIPWAAEARRAGEADDIAAAAAARFRRAWESAASQLPPAPDEASGFLSRYLYSWMGPYLALAYGERLGEEDLPPPRRAHRARVCGSRVSAAFREEEVLRGREAWAACVEAVAAADAGTGCGAGGVVNPLSEVVYRGEPAVRGRLRWVGYLRASDAPRRLYAGVEWDAGGALPAYRAALLSDAGVPRNGVVHDGCVHGERLFYQRAAPDAPCCTCERVEDVELVAVSKDAGGSGKATRPHTPSLVWVMLRAFKTDLLSILLPGFFFSSCQISNPILLHIFANFLESSRRVDGLSTGIAVVVVLIAQKLVAPLAEKKQIHRAERAGCVFQSATLSLIFEKCLSIAPAALADPQMSAGRILTMASSDVENMKQFAVDVMFLFVGPYELIGFVLYLCYLVGWSALAAFVVLAVSLVAQGFIAKVEGRLQEELSGCIDRRLRRTNELLGGIRIVKTMGWESRFLHSVEEEARATEQRVRRKLQVVYCVASTLIDATPVFMACLVLTVYVLSGHALSAGVAFPVLSILSSIAFPMLMIPKTITSVVNFVVSSRRVGRFLECNDQLSSVRDIEEFFGGNDAERGSAIVMSRATVYAWAVKKLKALPRQRSSTGNAFADFVHAVRDVVLRRRVPPELEWVSDAEQPVRSGGADSDEEPPEREPEQGGAAPPPSGSGTTGHADDDRRAHAMVHKTLLHDMSLRIPSGKLTVIVGATGSGKSSTLNAILGALGIEERGGCEDAGGVWACRDLAYVPQQPWIMQDSIRANITFFEDVGALQATGRLPRGRADVGVLLRRGHVVCSPLWRRRSRRGQPIVRVPPSAEEQRQSERIAAAVRCCQLETDLRELADGLETEIGEKGVNLSGGQKARIGLARAVYADRGVYLLDDPLSAVDVHVGRRLMRDVVLGALRAKTRVLVTHQVSVLPDADVVVVMREGRVAFTGSYAEYAASQWRRVVEEDLEKEKEQASRGEGGAEAAPLDALVDEFSPAASPTIPTREEDAGAGGHLSFTAAGSGGAGISEGSDESDDGDERSECGEREMWACKATSAPTAGGAEREGGEAAKLIVEEEKETGHVPWAVYRGFIRAGGGAWALAVPLSLFTENIVVFITANVWLSLWSTGYFEDLSQDSYLAIYVGINTFMVALHPVRNMIMFAFIRRACGRLHESLLYSITSATVMFFDQTPLGRIVNRFSKDMYVLDDSLTRTAIFVLDLVNFIVASLLLTMFSAPVVLIFVAFAAVVFWHLLRYYTTIIREIRRRASIAQSPMFSLLEEVTTGRESIDAYGKAHVIFEQALARLDRLYSARYVEKVVTFWLTIRLELLSSCIIMIMALVGLYEKAFSSHDVLPPGRVSLLLLALTMSMDLFWTVAALVEFAASVEADMNSAQRIFHYIHAVPHEDLLLAPPRGLLSDGVETGDRHGLGKVSVVVEADTGERREAGGAAAGSLEFRHVDMRYRPGLPLVLRDVSFAIAPREKIGVVGRTGSGKSTLLQTFMRLVEVCGGVMLVGGVPAEQLSLPSLRRRFALIPQDPVLFEGTVRSNLDPFGESSDGEVRRALELVGLSPSSLPAGGGPRAPREPLPVPPPAPPAPPAASHAGAPGVALDAAVTEGGRNFSVGQRQLLCLARALLKKGSEFILMDEATANIDPVLDRQVQAVVREQFARYTVITIAHRLHTVASYDRVFVMEQGRLVEAGPPRALVCDGGSVFRRMVVQITSRRQDGKARGGLEEGAADAPPAGSPTTARERREAAAVEAFLRLCKPE